MTPCRPSSVLQWLTLGYLLLLPLGGAPLPANMQWADLAFVALGAAVVATQRRGLLIRHPMDWLVAAYLAGSVVSCWRSTDLVQSGLGLAQQGSLVLVYLVFSAIARPRGMVPKIACWGAWTAMLFAGASLLALGLYVMTGVERGPWLSVGPIPGAGTIARIKGALLSPGFFCNYLTMALPWLILLPQGPAHAHATRWWRAARAVVMGAAMGTATASVAGFLAGGLASVWALWRSTRWLRLARAGLAAAAAVTLVVMNLMVTVAVRDLSWASDRNSRVGAAGHEYAFLPEGGAERFTVSVSYVPISYGLLKRVAVEAFRREPLTGIGLGAFHAETERAYQQGTLHQPYRAADPHAEWLGRLAETGLVGFVTLAAFWVGVFRLAARLSRGSRADAWVLRALIAGWIGVLVNSLNADVMNFRFLWVGLGVLRALALRC